MRYEKAKKDWDLKGFVTEISNFKGILRTKLKVSNKTELSIFDLKLDPHQGVI
jgi:hypothetical protein